MTADDSKPKLTRRQVFVTAAGVALAGIIPQGKAIHANVFDIQEVIKERIGDKRLQEGRIALKIAPIVENGNTVPISLSVESPMTEDDHVTAVHVFAEANPLPNVATFHFTPRSGKAQVATRIRLSDSQHVIAVAEMSNGAAYTTKKHVKVTLGGCSQ
ncbi:thiosulfate oxidation carrier protein SoxY [Candidatus Entotheonella serta]|nr:thiosulfate oxidation carrier protein SoxY [Candidatus Entotheonella serta]